VLPNTRSTGLLACPTLPQSWREIETQATVGASVLGGAARRVIDWLQSYWGAVLALIAFVGGLIGLADYLERKIEKHAPLRDWLVKWLVVPDIHDAYRDWLDRRLDGLQTWMGAPWSGTALLRCLAIAIAYPTVLLLISYGSGGPGTVGVTEFSPSLGGWRQALLGFGLLTVMAMLGLVVAFSERIDRHLLGGIEQRLQRRGIPNPQRRARWLYRTGAASAAASLGLAAALYMGVDIAVAVAFALAGAVAVAGAGAGAVAMLGIGPLDIKSDPISQAVMLFGVILPVANALWDWVSWWVSRGLGKHLLDTIRMTSLSFWRKAWAGLWHAGLDFLLALAFLALLVVCT
jgi:hypothetical protein